MKSKKYKRLVLAKWVVFRKRKDGFYEAVNTLTHRHTRIRKEHVLFLKSLNGKRDPSEIKAPFSTCEKEKLIRTMYNYGILRDKRFAEKSFMSFLLTLWEPENTINLRVFSYIANKLLLILWLPLLVIGGYIGLNRLFYNDLDMSMLMWGSITGTVPGMLFHEAGHMFACLAYSGKVYEAGLLFSSGIPGAYVMMDIENVYSRMKRIQINAAGIEMNFLLAGVSMLFIGSSDTINGLILGSAINNVFMALINLMFVRGLDGMTIMSELMGIDDMAETAGNILRSRRRKILTQRKGITGKATVTACIIVRILQLSLPAIIVINIMELIEWLF